MGELLEKYEVKYIFVGSCEREKYPGLNERQLQQQGTIVFSGNVYDTGVSASYIIEVG